MKTYLKSAAVGLSLATAALGLTTISAQAALIKTGNIILDESTNLEWLDLTQTANRIHTEITGAFGAGQEFAGWRHGTANEIGTLFTSAGYAPGYLSPADPAMVAMIDLLGHTITVSNGERGFVIGASGVYFDSNGLYQNAALLQFDPTSSRPAGLDESTLVFTTFLSLRFPLVEGHWLVRSAETLTSVPLPGALLILMIGLAGFGALRKRHA